MGLYPNTASSWFNAVANTVKYGKIAAESLLNKLKSEVGGGNIHYSVFGTHINRTGINVN